jgi:hypothetical protein
MRPTFLLSLLAMLTVIFGAVWYAKSPSEVPRDTELPQKLRSVNHPVSPTPRLSSVSVHSPLPDAYLNPEHREVGVAREVDRLNTLSMNSDPESLHAILEDLRHPEREVRETAIRAVKEFGSTNAIPSLKAAVDATEDIEEKMALLEAEKFLLLPKIDFVSEPDVRTPAEVKADAEKRLEKEARRQKRLLTQPVRGSIPSLPPSTNRGSSWEKN